MTKNVNLIPTVDDKIWNIEHTSCASKAAFPSFLSESEKKDLPVCCAYYKRSYVVDSVKRHPSNKDYVVITTTDNHEIDFPKFNDTPEKVMNRYYSSEEDVDMAIENLYKKEADRAQTLAQFYVDQHNSIKEALSSREW